jgi:hypothetical protein
MMIPVESPESVRLYLYGSIVIVSQLLDPQGRNPKNRPCIVLTPNAEMPGPDGSIDVVAISSIVPDPLLPEFVRLPWQLPFHPVTRLNKPSVAVCSWCPEVEVSRIIEVRGKVPNKEMAQIARRMLSL